MTWRHGHEVAPNPAARSPSRMGSASPAVAPAASSTVRPASRMRSIVVGLFSLSVALVVLQRFSLQNLLQKPAYVVDAAVGPQPPAPVSEPTPAAGLADPGDSAPDWPPTGVSKRGAGVLLFAYGPIRQTTGASGLVHFLAEAEAAARSCRALNPRLRIALVSNNATVDKRLFDVHLQPSENLLFVGDESNNGQDRGDGIPRQWLTRLYYLALSPFEITWALDSNSICCTPASVDAFLTAALATDLWGFEIVMASQRDGALYPHNWNFVYAWTPQVRKLLRTWITLQQRRGVTGDDQKTLLVALMETRERRGGLRIGQMSTPLAAAFHNVPPRSALMQFQGVANTPVAGVGEAPAKEIADAAMRADGARVTRFIHGPVHLVHAKDKRICAKINDGVNLSHPSNPMPPWVAVERMWMSDAADSGGSAAVGGGASPPTHDWTRGQMRQLMIRYRRRASNLSDWRMLHAACELDVGGPACELVSIPTGGDECPRQLDLTPLACPFAHDHHAKAVWQHVHLNNNTRREAWCSSHFFNYFGLVKTVRYFPSKFQYCVIEAPGGSWSALWHLTFGRGSAPGRPPLPSATATVEVAAPTVPPAVPGLLSEERVASTFDARSYAEMHVVFEPPITRRASVEAEDWFT